jgi:putative ATPase
MLEGGEEPRFIARRLVILASEDIGLADSRALGVAVAAFQACEMIGQPECEYPLAHATLFLALSPKSNSATKAITAAKESVRTQPRQEVPPHLKDSHTSSAKRLGHGSEYLYSHDFPEAISGQDYLKNPLKLYEPTQSGAEVAIAERLSQWRSLKESLRGKNKKHG